MLHTARSVWLSGVLCGMRVGMGVGEFDPRGLRIED